MPLGARGKGVDKIRWNGRVDGKFLPPGRYQITVRTFSRGRMSDLSKPLLIRLR